MGPRNQMAEINGGDPITTYVRPGMILQVTTRENAGLDRRSLGLIEVEGNLTLHRVGGGLGGGVN